VRLQQQVLELVAQLALELKQLVLVLEARQLPALQLMQQGELQLERQVRRLLHRQ
jgi:hypothetical protein